MNSCTELVWNAMGFSYQGGHPFSTLKMNFWKGWLP